MYFPVSGVEVSPLISLEVSFVVSFFTSMGGIYGVGGGAIIAPFLVSFFHLPIYTIAGATLFGTFVTSIAGALFYALIAPIYSRTGLMVAPDWLLGALFGSGGFLGIYCGARLQKYFPARLIKLILIFAILFLGVSYLLSLALQLHHPPTLISRKKS